MAHDVDWDRVAWDEPSEGGDEEAQAKVRYQQQTMVPLADQAEQRPLPEEVKKVVQWADRHGCLEDTVPGHAEWAQREGVFSEVAKSVQVTDEQLRATLEQRGAVRWPAGLTEAEKEAGRQMGMDVEAIDRWLRLQCEDIRQYVEAVEGPVREVLTQQGTAPLPESLHPGNKGPYLLDENGDIRTLKATAQPKSLHVRVGNLEIVAEGKPGGPAGIPFCGNSRILVDGKPLPVKSLVLRGNVDGLWTVELEFYPRIPKE